MKIIKTIAFRLAVYLWVLNGGGCTIFFFIIFFLPLLMLLLWLFFFFLFSYRYTRSSLSLLHFTLVRHSPTNRKWPEWWPNVYFYRFISMDYRLHYRNDSKRFVAVARSRMRMCMFDKYFILCALNVHWMLCWVFGSYMTCAQPAASRPRICIHFIYVRIENCDISLAKWRVREHEIMGCCCCCCAGFSFQIEIQTFLIPHIAHIAHHTYLTYYSICSLSILLHLFGAPAFSIKSKDFPFRWQNMKPIDQKYTTTTDHKTERTEWILLWLCFHSVTSS